MISESTEPRRAWTGSTDPGAAYREEFLKLLARLKLEPTQAIALVEAVTGQPFETCSPTQLVPLLQELLELLQSHQAPADEGQPWHA